MPSTSTTPSRPSHQVIGRVVAIYRYPVKSMAAEAMDEVDVSWHGLAGDRRWAFVRPDAQRNGFPWLTLRQRPDLNAYQPLFADPSRPDTSKVLIRTPAGAELDIVDPVLANELGPGLRAMKLNRGTFDSTPLSLITTRTVAEIGKLVGADLAMLRFRPNLVIEPDGDDPFPEDDWVDDVLTIGTVHMRVDRRDRRCMIVNIDPTTGQSNPAILRTITQERDLCLGVYGSPTQPGQLAVGDLVTRSIRADLFDSGQ